MGIVSNDYKAVSFTAYMRGWDFGKLLYRAYFYYDDEQLYELLHNLGVGIGLFNDPCYAHDYRVGCFYGYCSEELYEFEKLNKLEGGNQLPPLRKFESHDNTQKEEIEMGLIKQAAEKAANTKLPGLVPLQTLVDMDVTFCLKSVFYSDKGQPKWYCTMQLEPENIQLLRDMGLEKEDYPFSEDGEVSVTFTPYPGSDRDKTFQMLRRELQKGPGHSGIFVRTPSVIKGRNDFIELSEDEELICPCQSWIQGQPEEIYNDLPDIPEEEEDELEASVLEQKMQKVKPVANKVTNGNVVNATQPAKQTKNSPASQQVKKRVRTE